MTGLSVQQGNYAPGTEDPSFTARKMRLYGTILLVSLELLFSFSVFGYIHIPPVSVTFAYIPVILAGCFIGVPAAVIVGAAFGLSSMFKSTAHFVLPADQLFSPFVSGYPLESFVLSVGSGVLFGMLIGLLFAAARKLRHPFVGMMVVAACGKSIHSFIVLSTGYICFPDSGLRPQQILSGFFEADNIVGIAVTLLFVLMCLYALRHPIYRSFYCNFSAAYELRNAAGYRKQFYLWLTVIVLFFSVAMAVYFSDRSTALFNFRDTLGISRATHIETDILLLQIQFVIGILSLTSFFGVFLWMYYLNQLYLHHELISDEVTGLLNRKNFFRCCEKKLKSEDLREDKQVCFMIIDADYFKSINDTYGHAEGDRVLRQIADALRYACNDKAVLGRLGGDEFAAMIYTPHNRDSIAEILELMYGKVRSIHCKEISVSCSTGVVIKRTPVSADFLYKSADEMLYIAKERGRNQYVLEAD